MTGAAGIQRNKGHNLAVITDASDEGDTARSSRKARLFFFWIPDFPVATPSA